MRFEEDVALDNSLYYLKYFTPTIEIVGGKFVYNENNNNRNGVVFLEYYDIDDNRVDSENMKIKELKDKEVVLVRALVRAIGDSENQSELIVTIDDIENKWYKIY